MDNLSIFAGAFSYWMGLLYLTAFGSPLFIVFSYVGTLFLVSGFLARTGVIPMRLVSRNGVVAVLLYASAFLFTSVPVSLFADISLQSKVTHFLTNLHPCHDFSGDYVSMTVIRPYAWLAQPFLVVGAALFLVVIGIEVVDNFF